MKFKVTAKIKYDVALPSTMILNVQPFKFMGQLVTDEALCSYLDLHRQELLSDTGEKRFMILEIPEAGSYSLSYTATVENQIKMIPGEFLVDVPINRMPVEALSYLNPSRYCQSDKLYKFAFNRFGRIENAFMKVIAICDWIHQNVEYGGYTTAQTSAADTITEQVGVCRDFAHLGITLCRALTIPARYLTAYSYQLQPPDFHACFEAYLGGYWFVFDPTKLSPINGLIKIATGRDAADTAFAATFGNINFSGLEVNTELLSNDFQNHADSIPTHGFCFY